MEDTLYEIRHSLAHLLAIATLEYDPRAKLSVGPVTENGFYYDIDFSPDRIPKPEDFKAFEKTIRTCINKKLDFVRKEVSANDARTLFKDNPYKLAIIDDIEKSGQAISLYTTGNFTDLCEGRHVDNTEKIDPKSFTLTHLAGAYWRGDDKNPMLTRIYGLAFTTEVELKSYLAQQEEAKKRDHRILGEKLDLFCFDEHIGKGLPIWLPKGNIIKEELENWAKKTELAWGYQRVTTPIITKENLFYTSGHLPLYKDSMYSPIVIEGENYYLKPMNCPFHHKVFSARPRSYRELPLRIAEYGWCHRYEDSGSLFGLMRVRGMQMNDAHIYVSREQAVEEFVRVIKLHEYYYRALGITKYMMELALRDPKNMDKYHGNEEDWQTAEAMTREAMEKSGVPYTIVNEGAAFYGPKMDFQIVSSIGRTFTASTNQLDLFMGKQFGLEYTASDGSKKTPVVIHRAPLGTHERFIGFLIEHYAGAFPLWLAPVQVVIIPIGEAHQAFATEITELFKAKNIRVKLDLDNESLGKRIRTTKIEKIPYTLVIGDQEVTARTATLESREHGKIGALSIPDLISRFEQEIVSRHEEPLKK